VKAVGRFFGKEVTELARTWRLPVLGGVVLFFALTGPVLALVTPELLRSMTASQPGVVIQVPDPTWRDAYAQWIKNLTQIVSFVTIIVAAGAVAGEVSSGTAVLVLTKPLSRGWFVVVKAITLIGLVAACVVAGALLTQAITLAVFGTAPAAVLWQATLAWWLFAALLVAITTVLSSRLPTLAAAGLGVGAFFVLSLAALWGPAVRYTPVGLTLAPSRLLAGEATSLAWPVASTIALTAALVGLAAWLFSRREL
jgi:ABC-2 type transport system permease protein